MTIGSPFPPADVGASCSSCVGIGKALRERGAHNGASERCPACGMYVVHKTPTVGPTIAVLERMLAQEALGGFEHGPTRVTITSKHPLPVQPTGNRKARRAANARARRAR